MESTPPLSTYRLQFNKDFRFRDAEGIVPYLHALGVTHVYASPILAARAGSAHGYDVTDPTKINPELGTEREFRSFAEALRAAGMGLVLDIVPNHMAADIASPWWRDVLVNGQRSSYASFFDIDWEGGSGKLVLPLLGKPLERAVGEREIRVGAVADEYVIMYFDKRWPIDRASRRLADQAASGDTKALSHLLAEQAYRLAHYQEPPNYRRFFDINDLVSIRVEDEEVFRATHSMVLRLVSEGLVTGLRVDHVDGLLDPGAYLRRLREGAGQSAYIVVEKILGESEQLPRDWPVQGTTGYDFLAVVNGLFASGRGVAALGRVYQRFTGMHQGFEEVVHRQKRRLQGMLFSNEVDSLSRRFKEIFEADLGLLDVSLEELSGRLMDITARMPVYRTYADASGMPAAGRRLVDRVCSNLWGIGQVDRHEVLEGLRRVLALRYPDGLVLDRRKEWVAAVMRWQQLSGPATAKGVEDTSFYRYNRLVSLNEVGGHARAYSINKVHAFLDRRSRDWPHSMNASSTHDTKRSEDVRARINALSWMAGDWKAALRRWSQWNAGWKRDVDGIPMPDANMEWLLYQTLVGVWPLDDVEEAGLLPRLQRFFVKAAREAKEHTSWLEVNHAYEEALLGFLEALLDPTSSRKFMDDLRGFVERLLPMAAVCSLAQLTLKATAPGVPDFYRAQELWDFSLTDPDNRRPVDFGERAALLGSLRVGGGPDVGMLLSGWRDGRVKQFVTHRLLELRRRRPRLFSYGNYVRLRSGPKESAFGFLRQEGPDWVVVLVPRTLNAFVGDDQIVGRSGERLGEVSLPPESPRAWRNVFTKEEHEVQRHSLRMEDVLTHFPVAVLVESSRGRDHTFSQ